MSYQKQPELNGAYYGPPIPPPSRSYNRPRGGGGGGGCGCCLLDCLCSCGCCLLSCVFKIIFSILVFIGLIILIVFLIVRPHQPKFYADDAVITSFNLSSANQLSYNLAVNFTVRNPNKHISIYYDTIEANGFYSDHRFSTVLAPNFHQGTKNTTSFGPIVFKGQNLVELDSDQKSGFEKQSNEGVFDVMVRFHLRVRFKIGLFKTGTFKPKVKCDLKVPVSADAKSSQKFETTRCHYYF